MCACMEAIGRVQVSHNVIKVHDVIKKVQMLCCVMYAKNSTAAALSSNLLEVGGYTVRRNYFETHICKKNNAMFICSCTRTLTSVAD